MADSLESLYHQCKLCPRTCKANRSLGRRGYCGASDTLRIARAALHEWEEPGISVGAGSGAVFFSSCPLRCIFCQNYEIAEENFGEVISTGRLAAIFLELQQQGAANINLVTPTHFVPHIIQALDKAKEHGLQLPIVYNTSGYESPETLALLDGYVDIYLTDYKYENPSIAARYSKAFDYPVVIKRALKQMVEQTGPLIVNPYGEDDQRIEKGVIVRHLLLPTHLEDSKAVIAYVQNTYGSQVRLSIMNQYTPLRTFSKMPELNQTVSAEEYEELLDFADNLGVEEYFWQEGGANKESFVPFFNKKGVFGKEI